MGTKTWNSFHPYCRLGKNLQQNDYPGCAQSLSWKRLHAVVQSKDREIINREVHDQETIL